ncbi:hypothetical protein FOA52_007255 [Chlamydomonas sp. UWO 241]|nr:hypothetical protein FOA52_007255 [Chlamydomonas sp. UWO 241]
MWILPQQQDAARRKSIVEEWKDKYRTEPSVYPVDRQPDVPDPLNRGLTTDKLRKGGDI